MDQNAILGLVLVPIGLFWWCYSAESTIASGLSGSARKIVAWLVSYTEYLSTTIALVLAVLGFLMSLAAFFGYHYLHSRGWVQWYFGCFFTLVSVQATVVFFARLFLLRGKRSKLLE